MLQEKRARKVHKLLAVLAFCAFVAEGVHTARPAHTPIDQTADAAPRQDEVPAATRSQDDADLSALNGTTDRIASQRPTSKAASTDLGALLAQQDRSRQRDTSAGIVAVACASALPGLLLGIAFWFIVLWFWDRDDLLPACVAGICSAASIFTLMAVPETADLWARLFTPSSIHAIEAVSLSLLGIFALLFLYLLFPTEVTSVRIGRIELKPPATGAVVRPASCGGAAGRPASVSGVDLGRPDDCRPDQHNDIAASEDELEVPTLGRRRQLNTALLLSPMLALASIAVAAFFVSADHVANLFQVYDLLSLPIIIAVGIFLAGILKRRLPFARAVALAYGCMLIVLVHDILARSEALWSESVAAYAFAPFLALVGWTTIGHSVGRWKNALRRAWSREDELEKRYSATVAEARTLESSAQMQQRFVASTSHELRSPLTSILGFTELLEEELAEDLTPSHRGFIQSIRESAHRLLSLVNDLLDLAAAEDAGLEMRYSAVDVDDIVHDAVRHVYPMAQVKRLAMYLEKEGLGARVWADGNRLRQVVINLLSNAVKFTKEGRVLVRVRSAAMPGSAERGVAIEVEDTGRGISTEFMPRLFERFSREDDESYEGTGLGLAITKEFVEAMGGHIEVDSRLGEGSKFTIVLPAVSSAR